MEPTEFTIVNIPKLRPEDYTLNDELVFRIAEKNRALRLYSLKSSPEAFGSSYETEVERGLDQTVARLKTPQADHFFAVNKTIAPWTADTSDSFFRSLLEAEWIGMIVLIGPLTSSGSIAISAKRDPLSLYDRAEKDSAPEHTTTEPLHYQLNGTFVDPNRRRAGLGKGLIEAAMEKAAGGAKMRGQQLHCTVLVNEENPAARKLYERMGFCATGEESYVAHPRLGEGEMNAKEKVAIKMEFWPEKYACESPG